MLRRLAVGLGACALMVSSCTDSSPAALPSVSDDEILLHARNWSNGLGISAGDPDLWRGRLDRACTLGVWDHDVAYALAGEFLETDENAGRSIRVEGAEEPTVERAATALWLAAVNLCRDQFPADAIDRGPPGLG